MITRIITSGPNQNSKAYAELFEEASKALGFEDEEQYIASLNQYFVVIKDLIDIAPKFSILPLDEDFFEINANTRTINVPASFSKCASVKGDEIAETIFFIIDRYFDTTDLDTQQIFIEWKGVDGQVNGGFHRDLAVFKDTQSKRDKIIFGWALTSDVTAAAGNIEFAVRFCTVDEDLVDENGYPTFKYSFSTLPQKIVIKDTINAVFDDKIVSENNDSEGFIKSRIIASTPDQSMVEVEVPIYTETRYSEGIVEPTPVDPSAKIKTYKVNLPKDAEGVEQDFIGYIQGESADIAKISYRMLHGSDNKKLDFDYLLTNDASLNSNKTYYKKIAENGQIAYKPLSNEEIEAGVNLSDVYEKYGKFEIKGVGEYKLRILGNIGYASNYLDQAIYSIPSPMIPELNKDIQRLHFSKEQLDEGQLIEALPVTNVNDAGVISYEWKNNSGETISTTDTLIVYGEGVYTLTPDNYLNRKHAPGDPCIYKISYTPEEIELSLVDESEDGVHLVHELLTVKVEGLDKNRIFHLSDRELRTQWYKWNGSEYVAIEGANALTYRPNDSVRHKVTVVNVYNGQESSPKSIEGISVTN